MKQIIFFLLLLPCLAHAQADSPYVPPVDSSKIEQVVTLSQIQHTYIIGFLGTVASADNINYLNQIRAAYDTADMSKAITVTVPSYMIVNVYRQMSAQPEGQTSDLNNAILDALAPQLTNGWLLGQLGVIRAINFEVRDKKIREARDFIMSISRY